jgi:hypothetical protein
VDDRCDVARVSGVVASQARHFPLAHGIRVTPSGLRLEPATKPFGSFIAATPALPRARWTISLICECLWWRPALRAHARPWLPRASTLEPQRQTWGVQRLAPRRRPVATLMASFDIRSPTAVIGGAFNQSPACGEETAKSRARV